jgi:hypothetical protein
VAAAALSGINQGRRAMNDGVRAVSISRGRLLRTAIAVCALAGLATACAPDTINNRAATGFDAYLNKLKSCKPFTIGSVDLSVLVGYDAMGDQNYQYFVDQTSKLYYNRIGFDSYRQSLTGFFGDGSKNGPTFDCIFANLPADRPMAPAAPVITY